jgi:hypothetical protein
MAIWLVGGLLGGAVRTWIGATTKVLRYGGVRGYLAELSSGSGSTAGLSDFRGPIFPRADPLSIG